MDHLLNVRSFNMSREDTHEIFGGGEDRSWCDVRAAGASLTDKSGGRILRPGPPAIKFRHKSQQASAQESEVDPPVIFSILIDVWLDKYYASGLMTMKRYHHRRFKLERDRLVILNSEFPLRAWISVEYMLLSLQVSHKPSMVHKILRCAREMAANPRYAGYKVLRMKVTITIDDLEDGVPESPRNMVPATTKALEKRLKIFQVLADSTDSKDEDEENLCPICFEEISIGSQVARMPACSHLFHGDCLIYWLRKSKLCPLCRSKF